MHDDFYHKLQDSIKLDKTQPLEKYDVRNIVIGMERCLGHRKWKSSFQKEICMAEFLVWSLCPWMAFCDSRMHWNYPQNFGRMCTFLRRRWVKVITFSKRFVTHKWLKMTGVYIAWFNFCIKKKVTEKYIAKKGWRIIHPNSNSIFLWMVGRQAIIFFAKVSFL